MKVSIIRGIDEELEFEVPDKNLYYVLDRGNPPPLKDIEEELIKRLRNPISAPPLPNAVHKGDKVLIIVDDITRPTPQKTLLPIVLEELNRSGVRDEDIEVLIALGTHRFMTHEEIKERFGEEVMEKVHIINHDYANDAELTQLGRTGSGIPIVVNRRIVEADFTIGIGNIVPHCYAGWAGSGKIVQPGICGADTTAETHLMAGKSSIFEITGTIDNTVRKEIDEVAVKSGLKFIVNTILNAEDKISELMVGDPIKAFRKGVEIAEEIYCPKVPGVADIIIVSSYPADIDYWQAHKPTIYATLGVKKGGTVILVTPCPEGIAKRHPEVEEWGSRSYREVSEAIEKGEIKDRIAAGMLLLHTQVTAHTDVICVSEHLKKSEKTALGFKDAETVQEAIDYALKKHGEDAKIGVLRCGDIKPKLM